VCHGSLVGARTPFWIVDGGSGAPVPRSARASGASLAVIPSERSESRDLHPAGRYYGNVISRGVRGGARSSRSLSSRITRNGRGTSTRRCATILWRGARGGTRSRGGLLSGSRSPSQLGPPLHPRPQNQGLRGRHSAVVGAGSFPVLRELRGAAVVADGGAPLRALRVNPVAQRRLSAERADPSTPRCALRSG
jgi:hypothetical protein